MNTLELSKKICFKDLETKALDEYYNVSNIIINGTFKKYSSESLKYAITFQYCFKNLDDSLFKEICVPIRCKNISFEVISYLFENIKYLNLLGLEEHDYFILFFLIEHLSYNKMIYQAEFKLMLKIMKYISTKILNLVSKYNNYKFMFEKTFFKHYQDSFLQKDDYFRNISILFNSLYQYDPTIKAIS